MKGPGNLLVLLGVSTCSSTVLAASSDASSRPRGVGPECMFTNYHCCSGKKQLLIITISCKILQGYHLLQLYFPSSHQGPLRRRQRRLLRLPRWKRRARHIGLLSPLSPVALDIRRPPGKRRNKPDSRTSWLPLQKQGPPSRIHPVPASQ